jgi:hypothetical protein
MFEFSFRLLACHLLMGFLLLTGCASPGPTLISKSAVVPAGVDLSGFWNVRAVSDASRSSRAVGPGEDVTGSSRRSKSRRQRSSSEASVQVFIEYGSSLKITQTDYSVFISYDRSIVEEYTFGENRLVSVGPIEAKRVSGWEGNSFVVETLDTAGNTLFETWSLQESDGVLTRSIRISDDEKDSFAREQFFDRKK